jgi:peptidoglycan-associated lipoprotein
MTRLLLSLFFLAIAPLPAAAQATPAGSSRDGAEVAVQYTYVRSNAPPAQCDCFSLSGGGISVAQPWGTGHLAAVFDASVAHGGKISPGGYDLTLSSFTEGVRYRPFLRTRWSPYGQILVGVAAVSGTLVEGNTPAANDTPVNFASVVGGGLDYRLRGRWSLRLFEADYFLTTYRNGVNDHQNNLRIGSGVVYRFGR